MQYILIIFLFFPIFSFEPLIYISNEARAQDRGIIMAEVSAYTARMVETDSTPTITASNKKVREGIVANNCLPFGSIVEISGRKYEVQDRMNKRYGCSHFDVFHWSLVEARKFGRQSLKVVLLD